MTSVGLRRSLIAFVAFIGLALMPDPAWAQRGGGGGHGGGGGGGGSHGGGGGGFHGGGGSYGGGGYRGGGGYYGGGGYRGGGMAARGLMAAEEVAPQVEAEIATQEGLKRAAIPVRPEIGRRRTFVPQSTMASGIRSATPVVLRSSARLSEGRNSRGSANSSLSARNAGSTEGGWHSFGTSSGASARGASGFAGGASRATPGFGGRGFGEAWIWLWPRLRFGLGRWLGLGRLGLRLRMAVLGIWLGTRLGSLVVQPLLVCSVAGLRLPVLFGLRVRLVRQSAVSYGFVGGFVAKCVYDYDSPGSSVSTSSSAAQPEAAPNSPAPAAQPQPSLVAQPET